MYKFGHHVQASPTRLGMSLLYLSVVKTGDSRDTDTTEG